MADRPGVSVHGTGPTATRNTGQMRLGNRLDPVGCAVSTGPPLQTSVEMRRITDPGPTARNSVVDDVETQRTLGVRHTRPARIEESMRCTTSGLSDVGAGVSDGYESRKTSPT